MPNVLAAWQSFYVIVGSSSAALTGLMFVVVTLLPDAQLAASGDSLSAFGTPTVVHFCAALAISAVLCAPWETLTQAGFAVGLVGLGGLGYVSVVTRRASRQTEYRPVFEDWLWHVMLTLAAYGIFVASSIALLSGSTTALFWAAGATLLLLFIGIHNAWDTVTYIALERPRRNHDRD